MRQSSFFRKAFNRFAVLGLVLAAGLFVSGCGEQPSSDETPAAGASEPAAAGNEAGGSGTTGSQSAGGSDSK